MSECLHLQQCKTSGTVLYWCYQELEKVGNNWIAGGVVWCIVEYSEKHITHPCTNKVLLTLQLVGVP